MVDVGVVISVYGRYDFIGEAIESVLKQSLKPREIVVAADDPDRVPYRDKVYVVEAKDRKYGPAILRGIDATTSNAIALLEDDDKLHPDKLRIVARILERHPEVITVHNMQAFIDINGNPIGDDDPRVRGYVKGQPGFALLLNRRNAWRWFRRYDMLHHNPSSMVIRRSVFERHRPIIKNMELTPDVVLFVLSVNDGHYLHIPQRLTTYRVGSGNTTMDAWGDPARVRHRLCTMIRHFHDQYLLLKYVKEPDMRKLVTEMLATFGEVTAYWVYGWFLDCGVAVPISVADMLYFNVMKRLELVNNLSDIIRLAWRIPVALLSVVDRKRYAEISLRRSFGIDLQSLLDDRRPRPSP